MKFPATCPEKTIPLSNGGTLQAKGDFKICCLGVSCAKFLNCKLPERVTPPGIPEAS